MEINAQRIKEWSGSETTPMLAAAMTKEHIARCAHAQGAWDQWGHDASTRTAVLHALYETLCTSATPTLWRDAIALTDRLSAMHDVPTTLLGGAIEAMDAGWRPWRDALARSLCAGGHARAANATGAHHLWARIEAIAQNWKGAAQSFEAMLTLGIPIWDPRRVDDTAAALRTEADTSGTRHEAEHEIGEAVSRWIDGVERRRTTSTNNQVCAQIAALLANAPPGSRYAGARETALRAAKAITEGNQRAIAWGGALGFWPGDDNELDELAAAIEALEPLEHSTPTRALAYAESACEQTPERALRIARRIVAEGNAQCASFTMGAIAITNAFARDEGTAPERAVRIARELLEPASGWTQSLVHAGAARRHEPGAVELVRTGAEVTERAQAGLHTIIESWAVLDAVFAEAPTKAAWERLMNAWGGPNAVAEATRHAHAGICPTAGPMPQQWSERALHALEKAVLGQFASQGTRNRRASEECSRALAWMAATRAESARRTERIERRLKDAPDENAQRDLAGTIGESIGQTRKRE